MGYTPLQGETRGSYWQGGPGDSEDRMAAFAMNGIIGHDDDSMDASIAVDDVTLVLNEGEAYVNGMRFIVAPGHAHEMLFTDADGADDYKIYIDPTDKERPFQKTTAGIVPPELHLWTVDWNGTDTLSDLVDNRAFGLIPHQFNFQAVSVQAAADNIGFVAIPSDRGFWVEGVCAWAVDNGSAPGPTVIDVLVQESPGVPATSIWATAIYRPSLADDAVNGYLSYGTYPPDGQRLLQPGTLMIARLDAISTDVADISVTVYGRWC